ncbi:uncharacterized protein MELLADRAFT_111718 [Melampsora larici-populina 98AG31]|uniref:Uncharacterized protein n=1 Tax=Melampsora larici-populina (strain 98AG31 / pathotype 3-4-7) TaxID=747676 RepID=F4S4B1_MELLP|nr:uncharacterized protein MELLADRAFT_111718 [Melampsora larici-populina 98AG31]EGG00584.1 hypothetical protein MELLADRAFT_111718 [Melampsora larici-populina 98AG31]
MASLFCERISGQVKFPLHSKLPSEASSSAAKMEPEAIGFDRFTSTASRDIPIAMNKMGFLPSEEAHINSRVRDREDTLHIPTKRIKIEANEASQDPASRSREAGISTGAPISVPSLQAVLYSFFFQSAKKLFATPRFDPHIIKLAGGIRRLISKSQPWDLWIHKDQRLVVKWFMTAHTALHKGTLSECERTWALGIVAALVKYLRPITTDIVQRLKEVTWKYHVYLEIQAALSMTYLHFCHKLEFEVSLTERFKSLLMTSQRHPTNKALEECFSRARLFRSHDEIRARHFPDKWDGIDNFVSGYLLNVKIPQEDMSIKYMIHKFASYFRNIEIPSWEGTYAKAIFIYLMNHWQDTDASCLSRLMEWIEADFDLYRDLHLPYFKADVKAILSNPEILSRGITYDELIDTSKPFRAPIFKTFLSSRGKEEFSDSTQGDMYKLTVIASLIHPSLKELVTQAIDQNPSIIQRLAPVWLKMYPDLSVKSYHLFDYHYITFQKRPQYLASAHRQLLLEKMSRYSKTKSLGKFLQLIPLNGSKLDPSLHMIKFFEDATDIVLERLNKDIRFRGQIYHSIGHVFESTRFIKRFPPVNEYVLISELDPFLTSLNTMIAPQSIWALGELKNPKDFISLWAKKPELVTSVVTLGDMPDPKVESLQWIQEQVKP